MIYLITINALPVKKKMKNAFWENQIFTRFNLPIAYWPSPKIFNKLLKCIVEHLYFYIYLSSGGTITPPTGIDCKSSQLKQCYFTSQEPMTHYRAKQVYVYINKNNISKYVFISLFTFRHNHNLISSIQMYNILLIALLNNLQI